MPKANKRFQDSDGKFKKGNPGGGRPKGLRRIVDDIYEALSEAATGDELEQMYERLDIPDGLQAIVDTSENRQKAFAQVLVFRMLRGDVVALDSILARISPAPKHLEVSGRGGGPVRTANVSVAANIESGDAETEYFDLLFRENSEGDDESDHSED